MSMNDVTSISETLKLVLRTILGFRTFVKICGTPKNSIIVLKMMEFVNYLTGESSESIRAAVLIFRPN